MAGGSNSTISVGAAVKAVCDEVKKKIHGLACADDASPLIDTRYDEVECRDGGMYRKDDATKGETFAAILQRCAMDKIVSRRQSRAERGAQSTDGFVRHPVL